MATLATATEKKAHMGADEKTDRRPQRARVDDKFKIFCGTANEALCDEVCSFLGMTRGQALVTRFADGEAYVQIQENVRGADVFVMQPTCFPVDGNLMELLLMLDALKRASARFAKKIDAPLAIVDKRRVEMNVAEIMNVIGDVEGRTCLVIDDLIDTAGTLVKTAAALVENGASAVYACCSHPVLSGPAIENISKSCIKEVIVTNTIPLSKEGKAEPKIKVLSIAGLIGRAIQSIHEETSVSKLFL
jgi:phosphoribosylpyrophosphate synthetase